MVIEDSKCSPKKFLLEGSLSGLLKWLRFMGYPAEIVSQKLTLEIILKNLDKFFLVTSQETAKILENLGANYLFLPKENLKAQFFYLLYKLKLKPDLCLDLCSLCGEKLIPVKKEDFKERIPEKVWERYKEFNYCPRCDKLYWAGDHIKRLKTRFRELVKY